MITLIFIVLCCRLNSSGGSGWNAHKIEQTLWAHSVLNDTKKDLLENMPSADSPVTSIATPTENGTATTDSTDRTQKNVS